MRSLPAAVAALIDQPTGVMPVHVLELIEPLSGTVRFLSDQVPSAISGFSGTIEPRVLRWGAITCEATLDRSSRSEAAELELIDSDGELFAEVANLQHHWRATIWLWLAGTEWSDRVSLFSGVIAAGSSWTQASGTWTLRLAGLEHAGERLIGTLITADRFPTVACTPSIGQMIPIVVGDPCYRSPAHVIDRPAVGQLGLTLQPTANELFLSRPAAIDGFPLTGSCSLLVGEPGNQELVTGQFMGAGQTTRFSISSRGQILASGLTTGIYALSGRRYLLISRNDFVDPDTPRTGFPFWFLLNNEWVLYTATSWTTVGADLAVLEIGSLDVPQGTPWKIGRQVGQAQIFPVGSTVSEVAPWTYVVNHLPSCEITAVEAKGPVENFAGGLAVERWFTVNTAQYTVRLDDRRFQTAMDRSADDPGLTTIELSQPPSALGLFADSLAVTVRGLVADDSAGGSVVNTPGEVLHKLYTSPWLGALPAESLRSADFTGPHVGDPALAFSLTEPTRLQTLVSELAWQNQRIVFWDQGQVCCQVLPDVSTPAVKTLTPGEVLRDSLLVNDPVLETPLDAVIAEFRAAAVAQPLKLSRRISSNSPPAPEQQGLFRTRTLRCWPFQDPDRVGQATEHCLQEWSNRRRRLTWQTWLPGLALQPGDVVELSGEFRPGRLFTASSPRIRLTRVTHECGDARSNRMERITLTGEVLTPSPAVEPWSAALIPCEPTAGTFDDRPPGDGTARPPLQPEPTTTTTTTTTSTTTTAAAPCNCSRMANCHCWQLAFQGQTYTLYWPGGTVSSSACAWSSTCSGTQPAGYELALGWNPGHPTRDLFLEIVYRAPGQGVGVPSRWEYRAQLNTSPVAQPPQTLPSSIGLSLFDLGSGFAFPSAPETTVTITQVPCVPRPPCPS